MKNYTWKEFLVEGQPISCFGCPEYIFTKGKRLFIGPKQHYSYHISCANKVEKTLEKGFLFARRTPVIVRVKQITTEKEVKINDVETVNVKPGDYIIIGLYGEKTICTGDVFEQKYQIYEKDDK